MAGPRKYTDKQLLEQIRATSENGIAPSTKRENSLYYLVLSRFHSWQYACKLAGVRPRNRKPKRNSRGSRKGDKRTKILARALGIARREGMVRNGAVNRIMEYVRTEFGEFGRKQNNSNGG